MLDQHDTALELRADAPNQQREFLAFGIVQTRRGLIHQQEFRMRRDRASDSDAPLRAERQCPRRSIGNRRQSQPIQHVERAFAGTAPVGAAGQRSGLDVFHHRQFSEQQDVLKSAAPIRRARA